MRKFQFVQSILILLIIAVLAGCGSTDPVTPGIQDVTGRSGTINNQDRMLWGYYRIEIDPLTERITSVPLRNLMYAVNVNRFLNKNPTNIEFEFHSIEPASGYIDVDLDVTVHHPIAVEDKFTGYDVRGLFIGDGSGVMESNPDLRYSIINIDQHLMNPDGYTRWYNKQEFPIEGLFGYTPGLFGTLALEGTATLNGYKYFADGLGADEDVLLFLESNEGVFTAGSANTRRYQIRFPIPDPGLKFDYAVIADWSGGQPDDHPSHADEAVGARIAYDSIPYYTPTTSGGDLSFMLQLFSFGNEYTPSNVLCETSVATGTQTFDLTMQEPWDVGDNYMAWHFEFPADEVTSVSGNEIVVAVEYDSFTYGNPFGVPNDTDGDPLAAYFRFSVPVFDGIPPNYPPVINDGVIGPEEVEPDGFAGYFVLAVDPENDDLDYWWTITDTYDDSIVFEDAGDGPGSLLLFWDEVPGISGHVYEVDCEVTDNVNDPVMADTLTVTVL